MNIGILCPSEIAYRRFLPALSEVDSVCFMGVAVNTPKERYGDILPTKDEVMHMLDRGTKKAQAMVTEFGGHLYGSYEEIISDPQIDALYIPLPPALHYKWAKKALEQGKNVLIEKPSTTTYIDSTELVNIAQNKQLALHENYMFVFHEQMNAVKQIIESGELGEVRLYRISFGFPKRAASDFRYAKELGGGALLDAGGYTLKCAEWFLGEGKIVYAILNYLSEFDVDMYGSGAVVNKDGITAQISFGMDNEYKCELEVWGSKGTLTTGRILTAPNGFIPTARIKKGSTEQIIELPADDAFRNSICHFIQCINNPEIRKQNYKSILRQAQLLNDFKMRAEIYPQ